MWVSQKVYIEEYSELTVIDMNESKETNKLYKAIADTADAIDDLYDNDRESAEDNLDSADSNINDVKDSLKEGDESAKLDITDQVRREYDRITKKFPNIPDEELEDRLYSSIANILSGWHYDHSILDEIIDMIMKDRKNMEESFKEIDHTKTTKDGYYLDPSKGLYGIIKIENGKKLYLKSYRNDNPKWCQDYTYQVKYTKDKAEEIIDKLKGMKDKISGESLKESLSEQDLAKAEKYWNVLRMDLGYPKNIGFGEDVSMDAIEKIIWKFIDKFTTSEFSEDEKKQIFDYIKQDEETTLNALKSKSNSPNNSTLGSSEPKVENSSAGNKYLYHATDKNYVDNILKTGLSINSPNRNWSTIDTDGVIHFAFDANVAEDYVFAEENPPEEVAILKIKLKNLDQSKFGYDWNNTCEYEDDINSVQYFADVPGKYLEVCKANSEPHQSLQDFKGTNMYYEILDTFYEEVEEANEEDDDYDDSLKENNESLTEELEEVEVGASTLFNDLIQREYELLSLYESAQVTLNDHGEGRFDEVFDYIKDDINIHIGMLQAGIEDLSPSAEKVDDGKEQGEQLILDESLFK